jgi:ubiquinone biosynthesis protein COQ4
MQIDPNRANAVVAAGPTRGAAIEDQPSYLRIARGLRALIRLGKNPGDTQHALSAAILLNAGRLPRLVAALALEPKGRELLAIRPSIDRAHVDLAMLAALPVGSFGRTYHSFMSERGLSPDVFEPPSDMRDPRTRYVAQRIRQTHDLWHVLTGYNTDTLGETELQAFTYGQLRLPFSLIVAVLGLFRARPLAFDSPARVWAAYRRGRRAPLLLLEILERAFPSSLASVQAQFGLGQ